MKELSIEEKAKRYDEAIKKAKAYQGLRSEMEIIFPELKEREDERVWRELIEGFKRYDDGALFNGCLVRDIIAWLEKQGEHARFIEAIQVGDQVTKNDDGVLVNLSQLKRVAKPSEQKQGEQKPAEWTHKDGKKLAELWEILSVHRNTNSQVDNLMEWVKDLVSYKRQEWSEEEIENCAREAEDLNCIILAKHIRQLKSLRPQSTWKPSEEQMKVLKEAVDEHFDIDGGALWHLYEDLKKLREE